MLVVDSCNEEAHCNLMRCYSQQGRQHLALRQYHRCVEALRRELDVEPGQPIKEFYAQLRQQ